MKNGLVMHWYITVYIKIYMWNLVQVIESPYKLSVEWLVMVILTIDHHVLYENIICLAQI